jgi:heptosyltransferase I
MEAAGAAGRARLGAAEAARRQRTLLVSPCSSHSLRNWNVRRYAAVADHAAARGWRIVLSGGAAAWNGAPPTPSRKRCSSRYSTWSARTRSSRRWPARARRPRAQPRLRAGAHGQRDGHEGAGLFACTDRERCGPYSDLTHSVNHYDEAARKFIGKPAAQLRWGKRVEFPGVMDLIPVEEVIAKFDATRLRWTSAHSDRSTATTHRGPSGCWR